jgi:hypothetical protein
VVAPKQVYAAFLTNITRVLSESRAPTIRRTTQRNLLSVPIGWIAVGDPAKILPPNRHEAIWALQEPLNFPGFVYGFDRDIPHLMRAVTARLSERLGLHRAEVRVQQE